MDFELSDDQQLLQETARRFFSEQAPLSRVRAGDGLVEEVWPALAELGVLGALVGEEHGGSGMSMVDAGVVLEEAGRACFPGPLEESMVGAASAIALTGSSEQQERWLPGLAGGELVGTVAPTALWTSSPGGTRWTLPGVPGGMMADLVAHVADERIAVVDLRDHDVERSRTETVDLTRPQADLGFVGDLERLADGDRVGPVAAEVRDRMLAAAAVDGLGVAQLALEMAVAYAGERQQFGRPIGSFQAVQHLCADMLMDVEIGRAACYYALWACDEAPAEERRRAVTMAKAWASDAFFRVGATCIQVHGGIGFTWEHDAHLPYKRLLSLQHRLGGTDHHLLALADQVF